MSATASNLTDVLPPLILAGQREAPSRKRALAAARELPDAVLTLLSWDEDPEVRFVAAASREDERDRDRAFARLALDPLTATHTVVRANRRMIPDYALWSSPLWIDSDVRAGVAAHSRSLGMVNELGRDSSPDVRRAAASNIGLPDSELRTLSRDSDPSVANAAVRELQNRKQSIVERANDSSYDVMGADVARWSLAIHEVLNLDASSEKEFFGKVARASMSLDGTSALRVLRQWWIPPDVLRGLGTWNQQSCHVLEAVASNPSTPPEVLSRFALGLWGSKEACLALANPSIENALLERFATDRLPTSKRPSGPEMAAAWSNPALPEALLLSAPKGQEARRGLASNRSAPAPVLSKLAKKFDFAAYAASNPATPASALVELARNSSRVALVSGIARRLVCNPATPRAAFESLLEHRNAEVRACLAIPSGYTPLDILSRLASDVDVQVRLAAGRSPRTPQAAVDVLTDDKKVLKVDPHFVSDRIDSRRHLIEEAALAAPIPPPSTRAEAAAILIESLDVRFRVELARHAMPLWMLESEFIQKVLSRDPSTRVRAGLSAVVSETLRRILVDESDEEETADDSVVATVASRTRDPELAAYIAGRKRAWFRLASNPVTPAHVLVEIFDRTGRFHLWLAEHLNSPESLLAKLAETTPDPGARIRLAEHPNTNLETLASLSLDKTPAVRRAVAAHPRTPVQLLARLAGDTDRLVRAIVAMNRCTSPLTLEQLANDSDVSVRQLVASNPNSPAHVWTLLVVDPDPISRALVHRNLAPSAVARRELASQPETRPGLLQVLAADADREVRLAVAKRTDTPLTLLDRLAEDPSWSVRSAAKAAQRRARRQRGRSHRPELPPV